MMFPSGDDASPLPIEMIGASTYCHILTMSRPAGRVDVSEPHTHDTYAHDAVSGNRRRIITIVDDVCLNIGRRRRLRFSHHHFHCDKIHQEFTTGAAAALAIGSLDYSIDISDDEDIILPRHGAANDTDAQDSEGGQFRSKQWRRRR